MSIDPVTRDVRAPEPARPWAHYHLAIAIGFFVVYTGLSVVAHIYPAPAKAPASNEPFGPGDPPCRAYGGGPLIC